MSKSKTMVRLQRPQHRLLEDWCQSQYPKFKDERLTFERIADLAQQQLKGKIPDGINRNHIQSCFEVLKLAPTSMQGAGKMKGRAISLLLDRVQLLGKVVEDIAKQLDLPLPGLWKETFED
jgi:hypothetical protein